MGDARLTNVHTNVIIMIQLPLIAGFEWDAGNLHKCQQHGVTAAEIETLFLREVWLSPDPWQHETRLRAIGRSSTGRPVFLVFTIRVRGDAAYIRPISARYMHAREWSAYAEEKAPPVHE